MERKHKEKPMFISLVHWNGMGTFWLLLYIVVGHYEQAPRWVKKTHKGCCGMHNAWHPSEPLWYTYVSSLFSARLVSDGLIGLVWILCQGQCLVVPACHL